MRPLSPSVLNFTAGLFAAAGINMLTSVSAGASSGPQPAEASGSTLKLVLDSLMWVAAAAAVTWAAHLVEGAEQTANLYIGPSMSQRQREQIRRQELSHVSVSLRRSAGLTAAFLILAVMLLPGLTNWSMLACRVSGGAFFRCADTDVNDTTHTNPSPGPAPGRSPSVSPDPLPSRTDGR